MNDNAFLCVDDGLWHPMGDAQVVFGRQHLDGTHQTSGVAGRCQGCGTGLPLIGANQNFDFVVEEERFRLSLCFSATHHVYLYALEREYVEGEFIPVNFYQLRDLRKLITRIEPAPAIAHEDVAKVKQLLEAIPAGDLWGRLVGA